MNFTAPRQALTAALRLCASVADRKGTMPMLANVLLRARHGVLDMIATDLNVSVTTSIAAEVATTGGLLLSAKTLHDLVAAAPGDSVTLKATDAHHAAITSGRAAYRLVGQADREFPRVAQMPEGLVMNCAALADMIDRTAYSTCTDETRYHLTGVLLESTGALCRMVSTDGHRLSKVERLVKGPVTTGAIIPRAALAVIGKVLTEETCRVALAKGLETGAANHLFVQVGDTTIGVKLIDAKFPPYEQVIPKDHKNALVVDRSRLIDALRRGQLMASETRGVRVQVGPEGVALTSDNPDLGDVREDIEAEYTGQPLTVGWNPKYVLESLSHMECDEVTVRFGSELDPVIIEGDVGYTAVVMPMRV